MPDTNKATEFAIAFDEAFEKSDKVDEGEHIELLKSLPHRTTKIKYRRYGKARAKKSEKDGKEPTRIERAITIHDDSSANYISIGKKGKVISYVYDPNIICEILDQYFPFRQAMPASLYEPGNAPPIPKHSYLRLLPKQFREVWDFDKEDKAF